MKKLFAIVGIFISLTSLAQNPVPNPGFEDWVDYGNYEDPSGWGSNNYLSADFGVKPVESDIVSVEGLSAKMVTKVGQNLSVPGFLCSNGVFDVNTLSCLNGFPVTEAYSYFNGYAMYNPADADLAGITAYLWMWSGPTKVMLAVADLTFTDTNSDFEYFSAPFNYTNSGTPDSALIEVRSSIYGGQNPPAGSKLRVDNFELTNFTAVENLKNIVVSIYPNPATEMLSLHIPPTSEKLFIIVFDFAGRVMTQAYLPANEYQFSVKDFTAGIYYLQVSEGTGKKVAGTTFEVQH